MNNDIATNLDPHEAPAGFYAVSKEHATTINICMSCDARKLCQENADNWCLHNRCMSFAITTAEGKTYARRDGHSVIFKALPL